MDQRWNKIPRILVALGIVVVGWVAVQSEGVASGEFVLTDRIGAGSVLSLAQAIRPEMDGKVLYFQNGRPIHSVQLRVDQPYCKFSSPDRKLGEHLSSFRQLTVRFKNVARARWFFDHGVELECTAPRDGESMGETDFHQALGQYFQVEKHIAADIAV